MMFLVKALVAFGAATVSAHAGGHHHHHHHAPARSLLGSSSDGTKFTRQCHNDAIIANDPKAYKDSVESGNQRLAIFKQMEERKKACELSGACKVGEFETFQIPIVFHVMSQDANKGVTDAHFAANIKQMNLDFTAKNDQSKVPAEFKKSIGNAMISFTIQEIKRVPKATIANNNWLEKGAELEAASPPVTEKNVLNIYVANIGGNTLGYAYFPDSSYNHVVMSYNVIGGPDKKADFAPYDLGRTLTHEVGHYLGLSHPWGESGGCQDDDGFADTPTTERSHEGCPAYPTAGCNNKNAQTNNYMDYVNDNCMDMFTTEQITKMRSVLDRDVGQRSQLGTSKKNEGPTPPPTTPPPTTAAAPTEAPTNAAPAAGGAADNDSSSAPDTDFTYELGGSDSPSDSSSDWFSDSSSDWSSDSSEWWTEFAGRETTGRACHHDAVTKRNPKQFANAEADGQERLAVYKQMEAKQKACELSGACKVGDSETFKIPVVFHVLSPGPNKGLTDAHFAANIKQMNLDFTAKNDQSKVPAEFKKSIGNAMISFTIQEIKRVPKATIANNNWLDKDAKMQAASPLVTPKNVLNIYVCEIGGGILGYASFPGSGDEFIVMNYEAIGGPDKLAISLSFNLGRTLTHEVGHYLGLPHTWGNSGGCQDDDGFADTPKIKGSNEGCPAYPTAGCKGVNAQTNNYMDYVNDNCMDMFTTEQITKMRSVLDRDIGQRKQLGTSMKNEGPTPPPTTPPPTTAAAPTNEAPTNAADNDSTLAPDAADRENGDEAGSRRIEEEAALNVSERTPEESEAAQTRIIVAAVAIIAVLAVVAAVCFCTQGKQNTAVVAAPQETETA